MCVEAGAKQELGKPCQGGVRGCGYADTEELKKIDGQEIKVVVPSQRQALHSQEEKPFSKSQFRYDAEKDRYVCPQGKELSYVGTDHKNGKKDYRISEPGIYQSCELGAVYHDQSGEEDRALSA